MLSFVDDQQTTCIADALDDVAAGGYGSLRWVLHAHGNADLFQHTGDGTTGWRQGGNPHVILLGSVVVTGDGFADPRTTIDNGDIARQLGVGEGIKHTIGGGRKDESRGIWQGFSLFRFALALRQPTLQRTSDGVIVTCVFASQKLTQARLANTGFGGHLFLTDAAGLQQSGNGLTEGI